MSLSKYIGRDYETYNCFDLVKEFYADHFGLVLKNYFEGGPLPARKEIECLVISSRGDFVRVKKPKYGDVVIIRLYGYSSHIGVCIEQEKFIHSLKGAGSCVDNLYRYSKMIDGYYRHRECAQ